MTDVVRFHNRLQDVMDAYDGLILDQWGVLHDGDRPYPGVVEALKSLKARGFPVAILTNSSKSEIANRTRLARLGISDDLYGPLVSTADLLKVGLLSETTRPPRVFLLASSVDARLFEDNSIEQVASCEDAECVVLLTLDDATAAAPERADWVKTAARRGLILHTPSADARSVVPGGAVLPGFFRFTEHYRAIGGRVRLYGKPSTEGYDECRRRVGLGQHHAVAAVGDQFDTDVVGAMAAGLHPILVETGAAERERREVVATSWAEHLAVKCQKVGVRSLVVLPDLRW